MILPATNATLYTSNPTQALHTIQTEAQRWTKQHFIGEISGVKMAVFWDVKSCSLVEVYRRFTGACCLHHQGDEQAAREELV
jgi:hypothetical protein